MRRLCAAYAAFEARINNETIISPCTSARMFERFTESARRALFFARYEGGQLGWLTIELEHLLLGILRVSDAVADSVLTRLDCKPEALRRDIEQRMNKENALPNSVEIPFAASAKLALNAAAEESDLLGHNYIAPEHLLLGVLRQDGSAAASLLVSHGLGLDDARELVKSALTRPESPVFTGAAALDGHKESGGGESIQDMVRRLAAAGDPRERQELAGRILAALDALRRAL